MVFFAFDHSDITTHSAATIRRAAVDARALRPDGINITGYTDRSGQDRIQSSAFATRRARRQGRIGTRRIVWII